jgi:hypothetical protein
VVDLVADLRGHVEEGFVYVRPRVLEGGLAHIEMPGLWASAGCLWIAVGWPRGSGLGRLPLVG